MFNLEQKSINLNEVIFNLSGIGVIQSEISYEKEDDEIIFNSSNSLKCVFELYSGAKYIFKHKSLIIDHESLLFNLRISYRTLRKKF